MKSLTVAICLALLSIAVAACSSASGGSSTPNTAATLTTAATEIASGQAKTATAQSGNASKTAAAVPTPDNQVVIGNLRLVLNAVNPQYVDDVFPAEAGTHYVTVDITATNIGDSTYDLNPLNFHLQDSDKYTNDPALTDGPKPQIGAVSMTPGQDVRGFITFKIGDGRTAAKLQYQSFTGSAGAITIH